MISELTDELSIIKNRFQIDKIVEIALNDKQVYNNLLECLYHKNGQVAMRAAWIISHCAEKEITIVKKDQVYLIKALWEIEGESIKRSIAKTLSLMPLCDEMDGKFLDRCINAILSKKTAIANKIYLIDITLKFASKHPELASEIIIVLDTIRDGASKGILSKIKHTTKKLTILQASL